MTTEKQKLRIIKYKAKCEELCYKYIEHFVKNKKSYMKVKCNKCNFINNFGSSALMRRNIRCNNCLIIKYQSKCLELGYEYIEYFKKNKTFYIKCKCNKCDFINDFGSSSLMRGNIRCNNCLIIKYKSKCLELGHELIEYFRKNKNSYIKCKCNKCNFINDFQYGHLMKGNIRCNNCLIIKYKSKCLELGYEFIEHTPNKIRCKCNECNFMNDFDNGSLMKNSVKCKCKKKKFSRGFIYKLIIGPYYYIGLTDTTINTRYSGHMVSCFNEKKSIRYNSKIYKIIREELCRITKKSIDNIIQKDFKKYVLVKQVKIVKTSREDLKTLESELININNNWCLNSIL